MCLVLLPIYVALFYRTYREAKSEPAKLDISVAMRCSSSWVWRAIHFRIAYALKKISLIRLKMYFRIYLVYFGNTVYFRKRLKYSTIIVVWMSARVIRRFWPWKTWPYMLFAFTLTERLWIRWFLRFSLLLALYKSQDFEWTITTLLNLMASNLWAFDPDFSTKNM